MESGVMPQVSGDVIVARDGTRLPLCHWDAEGGAPNLNCEPPRADASADAPILKADGIILVAPAVWSRGDMPLTYRAALFLAAHLLPGMILSNTAASRVVKIVPSDNVEML